MGSSLIPVSQTEEEPNVNFEPVIRLTQQVETKTLEEDEDTVFKMCARLCATSKWLYLLTISTGEPSFSALTLAKARGRNAVLAMFVFCNTRKLRKFVW